MVLERGVAIALIACIGLSACGGGGASAPRIAYAEGPMQTACLRADRRSANRALCGCVQAAANVALSRRDQRQAVRFFGDPHRAQVVRQSDRASDEAFWRRYKVFVAQAEQTCG